MTPADYIIREVAERRRVGVRAIMDIGDKSYLASHARHEICYRLRSERGLSYNQIAGKLGMKDHTGVMHGVGAHYQRLRGVSTFRAARFAKHVHCPSQADVWASDADAGRQWALAEPITVAAQAIPLDPLAQHEHRIPFLLEWVGEEGGTPEEALSPYGLTGTQMRGFLKRYLPSLVGLSDKALRTEAQRLAGRKLEGPAA